VAIVAYVRHVNETRVVSEIAFLTKIQSQQEAYFQRYGQYANAADGDCYPALKGTDEPVNKAWDPQTAGQTDLASFGVAPENRSTYFCWRIVASDPVANHALDSNAATYGVPAQPTVAGVGPRPWFYATGQGDMDGDGTYTTIYVSNATPQVVTLNEGE
jgi:hypothetical protein